MDQLFGLPAHPLVVHVPVVLLPLAAILAIATLVRRAWYDRYRWLLLGITAVGTLGALLATQSGESLEESVEGHSSEAAVHAHAEAGELARTVAIVFLVVVAAYVLIPWWQARRGDAHRVPVDPDGADAAIDDAGRPHGPAWLRPALMALVAIASVVATVTVVDAGHSGADSVWNEVSGGHDDDD